MAISKEDLQAISNIFTKEFSGIKADVAGLKSDISGLKTDVAALKSDVSEVKSDVAALKSDVSEVKSDVAALKSDVSEVKSDVSILKSDVSDLKSTVDKNYQMLEEFYIFQRELDTKITEDLEKHQNDIKLLNVITLQHSVDIQQLKEKIA